MCRAVVEMAPNAHAVIMAAAVADFRPAQMVEHKIKKSSGFQEIRLERTDDILEVLQRDAPNTLRIGFAAETDDVVAQALDKLRRKGLTMVVANQVGGPNSPFDSETNTVSLVRGESDVRHLPSLPKAAVAHHILDAIRELLADNTTT
jgi:phosphopantothenoylcysteine decarboxylase/phosphopantothenate--cysteine ligase